MIPDVLAKLILKGDAEYITYSNGGSGVSTIPFAKNAAKMYVVSILWNPFYDDFLNLYTSDQANRLSTRSIHTHQMDTGKKIHTINFRDIPYRGFSGDTPAESPNFQSPVVMPLMIESEKDIHCRTFCFASPAQTTGVFLDVPGSTQEAQMPRGYADPPFPTPAIRVTETASNARIINMGGNTDPGLLVRGNLQQRDQFFDNVSNLTALNDAITGNVTLRGQYMYPLVTYGVVIVNKIPSVFNF